MLLSSCSSNKERLMSKALNIFLALLVAALVVSAGYAYRARASAIHGWAVAQSAQADSKAAEAEAKAARALAQDAQDDAKVARSEAEAAQLGLPSIHEDRRLVLRMIGLNPD